MDRKRVRIAAAVVLAAASARADVVSRTCAALEKPLHAAVVWFAMLALLALGATGAWRQGRRTVLSGAWEALAGREEAALLDRLRMSHRKVRLGWITLLTLAVLARAVVFKYVVQHSECKGVWGEVFLPLAMVVVDALVSWRRRRDQGFDMARHGWLGVSCAVYGLGACLLLVATRQPSSTYICPSAGLFPTTIPLRQWLGVVADVCILRAIVALIDGEDEDKPTSSPPDYLYLFSLASTICATSIFIFGIVWYYAVPDDSEWTGSMPAHLVWGSLKLGFLLCLLASTFVITVVHLGCIAALLITICGFLIDSLLGSYAPLVPQSSTGAAVALLLLCISIWQSAETLALSSQQELSISCMTSHKMQRRLMVSVTLATTFWITATYWSPGTMSDRHPVSALVIDAKARHERWASQAASSTSLSDAVSEYQKRYHKAPPPGFDQWFEYASSRNSAVIDDFDNIQRDLAPFTRYSPHTLRHRTWEAMANPDHDVAGIRIRNGEAVVLDNVRGSHRWMLDGVVDMISKFQQHLPDMDLGFNLNDEPRISGFSNSFLHRPCPEHKRGNRRLQASHFSDDRAAGWHAAETAADQSPATFQELSGHNIFVTYGSSACDRSSSSEFFSDASRFCASCVKGHSDGVFLSDWTASTDICKQPDLVRQHGFYSSPASFKGSHDLYPIFSQSKAPYFADILYPSPWNYLEKAEYAPNTMYPDPPFAEKTAKLYWQGSTSEGYTHHESWRGFTRERFVNTVNDPSVGRQLIPLPTGPNGALAYHSLPAATLQRSIATSVHFSDIVRCFGPDCNAQMAQFSPLAPNADFQSHWRHAYLLDLDGAGFSGRFLPFLRSRSLPLKAALFREWYDDRLAPWWHFVPLDLRAHGLWATLVYFAGWKGEVAGRRVEAASREARAEEIANAGKAWAEKALRREDMEIYMFRLLLEWGRLTDDKRDEIGFVML